MTRCVATVLTALALGIGVLPVRAKPIDDDAGSRGFKFLQIIHDAGVVATGSASAAVGGQEANPAGLAAVGGAQVTLSHTEWLASIRHEHLGIAWPAFDGAVSVGLRTQSSGDIPLRAVETGSALLGAPSPEPSGTYGVYDAALSVGYARQSMGLEWGVTAKLIYEKIYFSSVTAVAFDLGARRSWERWSLGASLRNLGRSGTLRDERVLLPWDGLVGAAYRHPVGPHWLRLTADVRYAPDYFETLHLGAEMEVASKLALRCGYRTGLVERTGDSSLTAGLGLRLGPVRVDYAYIPGRAGLGGGHSVSLGIGG